jgi:hypothetical protein
VSQRNSGDERRPNDDYSTPYWVTEALIPHLPMRNCVLWECAAGSGQMVDALRRAGFTVIATDIAGGSDFLTVDLPRPFQGIVTNPPYELATEFIERALSLIPTDGFVAMLLRCDFDSAKTRGHLFGRCPEFAKKLTLVERIRWFEDYPAIPSFNHAWFLWSRAHSGPPTIAYAP